MPTISSEKWMLAEEIARKIDVEYGEDLASLLRMDVSELERRKNVLDSAEFEHKPVGRRKAAGEGLRSVENTPENYVAPETRRKGRV